MTHKTLRTDTDWHELWQDMMSKCYAIAYDKNGRLKQWSVSQAKDYLQYSNPEYYQALIALTAVTAEESVLDIGCGPGVLSLPFSKVAKTVTAVDSAPGMLEVLCENMKPQNLRNITCVNKAWRTVQVGVDIKREYDVVISSNSISLLGVREQTINGKTSQDWNLVEALSKMTQVGKRVYVTFRLGGDNDSELFRLLGKDYQPHPNHIILYNVLHQMGIRPNFEVLSFAKRRSDDSAGLLKWLDWIEKFNSEEKEAIMKHHAENERNLLDTPDLWGIFWWKNTNR
ncbi:MAG: class I SAM-dependent methyltransferase [Candidatus Bathyarchaeota archaeon]|nr:class I SAM-dependent methyltransferase [Candidatus Bathyarchaeota archaeon]